jgi:opacity protein-like surface antigen
MKILASIIVLLLGLVPAAAADISLKDSPYQRGVITSAPEASAPWSGLWAAALAGYRMSNTVLDLDVYGETEGGRETFNLAHVDGFGGEDFHGDLQLGGDVQLGRFLVGAFAEYSFGGIESQVSIFEGAGRLDVEQDDSWSILARAGIISGETLFYVASGYTETTFKAKVSAGDESASRDLDFSGIPLEIGVEHRFSPNVRGRLAGRYTWLDEETVFKFGDEDNGVRLNAEPGIWEVKLGVVISTSGLNVFGN